MIQVLEQKSWKFKLNGVLVEASLGDSSILEDGSINMVIHLRPIVEYISFTFKVGDPSCD